MFGFAVVLKLTRHHLLSTKTKVEAGFILTLIFLKRYLKTLQTMLLIGCILNCRLNIGGNLYREAQMADMTQKEREQRMRQLLTDDFLAKLTEAAKLYGWRGDYVEIGAFVEELHKDVGKEPPFIEPYEVADEPETGNIDGA